MCAAGYMEMNRGYERIRRYKYTDPVHLFHLVVHFILNAGLTIRRLSTDSTRQ